MAVSQIGDALSRGQPEKGLPETKAKQFLIM